MTAPPLTVDVGEMLITGGVPADPPRWEHPGVLPPCVTGPDITPAPADESPSRWQDWRTEVLGATWMRVP